MSLDIPHCHLGHIMQEVVFHKVSLRRCILDAVQSPSTCYATMTWEERQLLHSASYRRLPHNAVRLNCTAVIDLTEIDDREEARDVSHLVTNSFAQNCVIVRQIVMVTCRSIFRLVYDQRL